MRRALEIFTQNSGMDCKTSIIFDKEWSMGDEN